jgi:hypothetical protein
LQGRATSEFGASSDKTLQIATERQQLTKFDFERLPMSLQRFDKCVRDEVEASVGLVRAANIGGQQ